MNAKIERLPVKSPNPALSVGKDGTVLYSNEACKPLLRKWGCEKRKKIAFRDRKCCAACNLQIKRLIKLISYNILMNSVITSCHL